MYCQIFPGLHFFLCCINCVHHPNAKNQWGLLFLWKLSVFFLFVFVLFILGGKFYESKEINLFTSLILGLIVDEC